MSVILPAAKSLWAVCCSPGSGPCVSRCMNSADPRPLKSIITICFIGSCVAMITGTTVALLMGATPQIAASILPKSVHYADCYGG